MDRYMCVCVCIERRNRKEKESKKKKRHSEWFFFILFGFRSEIKRTPNPDFFFSLPPLSSRSAAIGKPLVAMVTFLSLSLSLSLLRPSIGGTAK
jgi:hypothetical protein